MYGEWGTTHRKSDVPVNPDTRLIIWKTNN